MKIEEMDKLNSNKVNKKNNNKIKKEIEIIDNFKIDNIMENLKSAINKNQIKLEEYDEVVWLLKLLLKSDVIFPSTSDVNLLLENLCGFAHNTKSTGRDRIVDWYFRELEKIENVERWGIIKKIAKYSFVNIPSDFKGWKRILDKKGKL